MSGFTVVVLALFPRYSCIRKRCKHVLLLSLQVNGENLLTIEYDRDSHTETILDRDLLEIITMAFDASGRPTHFLPARRHHSLNVTYDTAGEVVYWRYGEMEEKRVFESGLLKERTGNNGAQYRYNYRYGSRVGLYY